MGVGGTISHAATSSADPLVLRELARTTDIERPAGAAEVRPDLWAVSDASTDTVNVLRLSEDGEFDSLRSISGPKSNRIENPGALASDGEGMLYLIESGESADGEPQGNVRVVEIEEDGDASQIATIGGGKSAAALRDPVDLVVGNDQQLYVLDAATRLVSIYAMSQRSPVLETSFSVGERDSTLTSLAVTSDHRILVADATTEEVRVFATTRPTDSAVATDDSVVRYEQTQTIRSKAASGAERERPRSIAMTSNDELFMVNDADERLTAFREVDGAFAPIEATMDSIDARTTLAISGTNKVAMLSSANAEVTIAQVTENIGARIANKQLMRVELPVGAHLLSERLRAVGAQDRTDAIAVVNDAGYDLKFALAPETSSAEVDVFMQTNESPGKLRPRMADSAQAYVGDLAGATVEAHAIGERKGVLLSFVARDGGVNDADGKKNGQISVNIALQDLSQASHRSQGATTPPPTSDEGSGSCTIFWCQ